MRGGAGQHGLVAMTTGTCVVACLTARTAGVPSVTMTSMRMPVSSAASAGKRTTSPAADRNS
jgi:hypothetical protein